MQKRHLGQTGIEVSVIGLGTVKFGRNQGVKYPRAFKLPNDGQIADLLAVAKELGINLLDTAPAYGTSEERLGKALRGQREDWVLATKAGEEFVDGQSHFDFTPLAIQKSVERSLKRLQTDYLDIVLIHSNGEDEKLINDDVFSSLVALKQAGKICSFGMSTKTIAGGKLAVAQSDVVMVTLNPEYTDEREVIAYAKEQQKGVFVKKALGSGHLPAAESLAFLLQEPGVTSIILGTLSKDHLRENVMHASVVPS